MSHKHKKEGHAAPAQPEPTTPAAATPNPAPAGDELAALRAEIEAARAAAAEANEKFLRAVAESENMRRRAEAEAANARKFAVERFAGEMLAVRDSLELARAVDLGAGGADAVAKMHEGLDLTLKLMDNIFQKFALTTVAPQAGEKFDPSRHQAMGTMESGEMAPNHVLTLVQKGYLLHERLLRPAMVIVSKAAAANNPAG